MPKNVIETTIKESLLRLFLLKNDQTQNVELQKVTEIDSKEIKRYFENGESVYKKLKKEQKSDVNFMVCERESNLQYIVRS